MNKNLIGLVLAILVLSVNTAYALGEGSDNIFKDSYIAVGMGKSFPHGKVSSYTIDDNKDFYAKQKLKDSNIYRAAIGKGFGNFRAELEFLNSSKHKFNNSHPLIPGVGSYRFHTSHNAYFVNAYYDFKKLHEKVAPYIGLGAGISQNTVSNKIYDQDGADTILWKKKRSNQFAYNVSLGVLFNISKIFYVDLSYKYIDLGKLKSNSAGNTITTNLPVNNTPTQVTGRFKANVLLFSVGAKF